MFKHIFIYLLQVFVLLIHPFFHDCLIFLKHLVTSFVTTILFVVLLFGVDIGLNKKSRSVACVCFFCVLVSNINFKLFFVSNNFYTQVLSHLIFKLISKTYQLSLYLFHLTVAIYCFIVLNAKSHTLLFVFLFQFLQFHVRIARSLFES